MLQARRRFGAHPLKLGLTRALIVSSVSALVVFGGTPAAVGSDMRSKLWYLDALEAEEIWKTARGEGITVAVIDTGVNADTPSLKGQVLKGFDFTDVDGDATDDYGGHGTTMAELIAGTGKGDGIQGLAPGVKILPMRVPDEEFAKDKDVNLWGEEDAIRAAADSGAKIISLSMGGEFSTERQQEAVRYAQKKGKLFFASVGNNAKDGNAKEYPAAHPEVVGVGATDRNGKVSDYSQNGDIVDLAAPADNLPRWCDETFQSYCMGDGGTSSATAITSAAAALIWSAHPDWTANQVLRVMFDTAGRDWPDDEVSKYLGHGLIRPAVNILDGEGDPGDPDISPLTNKRTTPKTPNPSPSTPAKSKAGDDAVAAGSEEAIASDSKTGDGSSSLPLIIGGAALVAVLLGGAAVTARRRRAS
ncbi:S8 family serine peptidase [Streptomyces sp. GC420]|nr:S8 family serine peptidase [Streptomyces sp. GC420]NBM20492.1 S8 family serine peptidase [Streptomyces sp. GC420]